MGSYRDFFVDFALGGRVCGAGLGDGPGAWIDALGPADPDWEMPDGRRARDWGFVGTTFDDERCTSIILRVERLSRFPEEVPATVAERYGDFPARVAYAEFADRLPGAGQRPRNHFAELEEWSVAGSGVTFYLVSDYQVEDLPRLRLGDLYSAGATYWTAT